MGSPPALTLTATGADSSAQGTSDENEIALIASSTESSTPFVQRSESAPSKPVYRVHKRRFFGLAQLILLNIVVSWDWLTFSAISTTSARYFQTTESAINWLSTGFLFAFCVATPVVIWTLNRGPKPAMIAAACLLLLGNWVRYAGTRATNGRFGVVMFGQILIGLAQPFVLTAPTRYSDTWFSDRGRTSATAIASLANPFGGALAQLIDPAWVSKPSDIPNMVLYISIISSVASLPSFFLPAKPPTPPSASASSLHPPIPLLSTVRELLHTPNFYLITIPFSVLVGHFNAFSSLINQILEPYGFSEDDAGIAGALLIIVGLVTAAISSPLVDRYKFYLPLIKILVPLLALSYFLFIFAPRTGSLGMPYALCALCGATSFGLVPVALEYLVEVTYPLAPEVGSTLAWTGGQLLGGLFIVIETALKNKNGHPKNNMQRALIFQAVLAIVIVPFPLALGYVGGGAKARRLEVDKRGEEAPAITTTPFRDDAG